MDGGHLVARALKSEGVEFIFTLCGGHIASIYEGCADEGIRVIDFRHEQAAAHAAEGWGKVTGRPGVAVVTAGPGVTNAVTAVADAFRTSAPMILIGGRSPLRFWGKGSLQELDEVELLRPITKWARTVLETKRIPEYLSMAFRYATVGKPGPVLVEIPMDIVQSEIDEAEVLFPTKYRTSATAQGAPEQIKAAAKLLAGAEEPVVIAGNSVWLSQASHELQEFVEAVDAPVFLNSLGRGSVPSDHRLFFSLSRWFAFSQADLVVVIGTPFDFRLGFGNPLLFRPDAKVIQIDLDAADIGHNREVEVGIVGDIKAILMQLTQEIGGGGKRPTWVERLRQEERRLMAEDEPFCSCDTVPIHPLRLGKEIDDFIDRDATVIGDGGDVVTFGARVLGVYHPGHRFDPGQNGCLGIGGGFSIAAKLARPQKQVLLLSGDGSFGLSCMEFDTMVRHNIPVVSVIGNDGAWGQVSRILMQYRGRAIGAELSPGIRYDKLVEALGGHGEFVERPEDIRPALERAFASGLPACVNVITDPTVSYSASYDSPRRQISIFKW